MTFPALPVTWSLDGMLFNVGTDAQGHSLVVDVPAWDNPPPPKPRVSEKAEAHGAFQGPNYRGGVSLRIIGTAQALTSASREILRDRLAGLCLDPDTFYPLTCHNPWRTSGDLTMWVKLDDLPDFRRKPDGVTLNVDIPVFAADPWKYSADNNPQSTGLATAGLDGILWNGSPTASGGIEWNGSPTVTGGLIYESGQGSTGLIRLTNSGNQEAPILMTISGSVTNPQLVAVQSQQRIRWVGTVTAPDVLTIDTKTGRVTLGPPGSATPVNVAAGLSDAQFFKVPANSFLDIAFTATSGSGTIFTAINKNVYA
jgi:hypothetical protein